MMSHQMKRTLSTIHTTRHFSKSRCGTCLTESCQLLSYQNVLVPNICANKFKNITMATSDPCVDWNENNVNKTSQNVIFRHYYPVHGRSKIFASNSRIQRFNIFQTSRRVVDTFSTRGYHAMACEPLQLSFNQCKLSSNSINNLSVREYSSEHRVRFFVIDNQSPVVEFVRDIFLYIHDTTGLPMWGTICLFGIVVKIAAFPLTVIQKRNTSKLVYAEKLIDGKREDFQKKTAESESWKIFTESKRKSMFKKWENKYRMGLFDKLKCSWWTNFFLQGNSFLLFVYSGRGIRALCPQFQSFEPHMYCQDMTFQGLLWFSDLASNDFILPIINWAIVAFNVEMAIANFYLYGKEIGWIQTITRLATLAVIPIGCILPSCVPLVWIAMSSTQLALNCIARCPSVYNMLKSPVLGPIDSNSTPNRDLLRAMKNNFFGKRSVRSGELASEDKKAEV